MNPFHHSEKPHVVVKPQPPASSWWIGLTRDQHHAAMVREAPRMACAVVTVPSATRLTTPYLRTNRSEID